MLGKYDDLDLRERCESLKQARNDAHADEADSRMRVDYTANDPRGLAYIAERNRIRAAAGKGALKFFVLRVGDCRIWKIMEMAAA